MDNERGFWKKSIDPGSPYCSPLPCLPILFPPTCVSLVGWSGMRAASIRDFLRALTIIAWNVVIVCRRSKTTVSMYVTIYVNTGSWSNVRSKRGGMIRGALSMYRSWRTLPWDGLRVYWRWYWGRDFYFYVFFLILFFDLIDGKGSVLILALVKIEEFEFWFEGLWGNVCYVYFIR